MLLRDRQSRGPAISRDGIHVWSIVLNGSSPFSSMLFRLLSSDEQNRATQLLERLQNRFVMARGMLRVLLSCYLELAPEKIALEYTAEGKPVLASQTTGGRGRGELSFNLSHSNDLALYAIALDREVGVDVEQVKPVAELEAIAEQNFSLMEFGNFKSAAPENKLETFYRIWTRKEAYIKATGQGLSAPLNSWSVPEPRSPIPFTPLDTASSGASSWFFHSLCPSPGYIASLAFRGPEAPVQMWTFASAEEAFAELTRSSS